MATEEFRVRISRKGEVILEVDGMPARRIKDVVAYLEETLGPVRIVDVGGAPGATGRQALEDAASTEIGTTEEVERDRLREQAD